MKGRKPTTLGYRFSEASKEKMRAKRRAFLAANPDYMKEFSKKGHAARRLPDGESAKRARIYAAMKRFIRRVLVMTRKRRDCRTEVMLGYTKEQLRTHLEAQFIDGMGWHDKSSFHIDHFIPFRVFMDRGIEDPRIINALWNLRVLTPSVNQHKSDIYDDSRFDSDMACLLATLEGEQVQSRP